jgi:hypothetical protein
MKRIFLLLAALLCINSYAKTQVINAGSPEGQMKQTLIQIAEGTDYSFSQANNPIVATQLFKETKDLILTTWDSAWVSIDGIKDYKLPPESMLGVMITHTMICSRQHTSFDSMKGKTVKISTWGSSPVAKILKDLGKEHNINFVVIPYSGSGAAIKGYIGNDADTIFTISSRMSSVLQDTSTNCFAFSEKDEIKFKFVDGVFLLNGSQSEVDGYRNKFQKLITEQKWLDANKGTQTIIINKANYKEVTKTYSDAVISFGN